MGPPGGVDSTTHRIIGGRSTAAHVLLSECGCSGQSLGKTKSMLASHIHIGSPVSVDPDGGHQQSNNNQSVSSNCWKVREITVV